MSISKVLEWYGIGTNPKLTKEDLSLCPQNFEELYDCYSYELEEFQDRLVSEGLLKTVDKINFLSLSQVLLIGLDPKEEVDRLRVMWRNYFTPLGLDLLARESWGSREITWFREERGFPKID